MSKTLKLLGAVTLFSFTLVGCAPTSQMPSVEKNVVTKETPKSAADYLLLAIQQQGQSAAELRIKAAQLLLSEKRFSEAADSLSPIELSKLQPGTALSVVTLQAEAHLKNNDVNAALDRLTDASIPSLNADQQAELGLVKATAFERQGNALTAALVLSDLSNDVNPHRRQQIHDRIWTLLQPINNEELIAASFANYGFSAQGWIELSLALAGVSDLTAKRDAILSWQQQWTSHPAKITPPTLLTAIINQKLLSATRILVALPLSGTLSEPARIILEGILAEFDQKSLTGLDVPELVIVDSQQLTGPSLLALATEKNVDLVLGPLRGKLIDELGTFKTLPIPFISFNQTDRTTDKLFQLDLGSDQEIKQIVERATLEGHTRFALITPSAPWANRIGQHYKESISEFDAQLAVELNYEANRELSSQIASMLNTQLSNERYQAIKKAVAEPLEYDERPRRDIDAILIAAQSSDASQIKPMLSFHFAGDYPVYATSHLFEGDFNVTRDVDLNSVQFPDQPWLLTPTSALNQSLALTREDTASRLGRLYALGADAARIYPFLIQLQNSPELTVKGETGTLSLDERNRFIRTLTWAKFDNGVPVILGPPLIPEPTETIPLNEENSELADIELN